MKNYTKQRGYLALPTPDGDKWMHFSMNFIINLQELTGIDIATWGKNMQEMDEYNQGLALCELVYASMAAHDQEEGNVIDYNVFKVRNWALEEMNGNEKLAKDILEAMTNSLGKFKEKKVLS